MSGNETGPRFARPRTYRRTIDQPLAYTKEEALAELNMMFDKLTFGQEIDIRRARDRPEPTPSVKSKAPALVTIARVQLMKERMPNAGPPVSA